jgi:hypothetical protein
MSNLPAGSAWRLPRAGPLEGGAKKSVRSVHVGPQTHALRYVRFNTLLAQNLSAMERREFRVGLKEAIHDFFVLLAQQTARCVNQPPACFHQSGRCSKYARLLFTQLCDAIWRLPPFQIWIATHCPETAARRVDEHAIDLACEAFDLRIVLASEQVGVKVGQT